jgi:Cupin-like domain
MSATWLDYDPAEMSASFDRRPFTIRHRLAGHPLLQLPRIIELQKFLSSDVIEFNRGDIPISQDYLTTPKTGLSAEETLRQIEVSNSWMVLKYIERDPEYRQLLEQCLAQVRAQTDAITPGMRHPEGFLFVSSPRSITSYHMDPEHNFLLQIQGTKQMTVFDGNDRSVLSETQLENFHSGAHRNIEFREELAAKGKLFTLTPGIGLHVPVTAPHWVKNGDAVSVSLSITFRSNQSVSRSRVYRINAKLRGYGLQPTPPGQSSFKDYIKACTSLALDRVKSWTTPAST